MSTTSSSRKRTLACVGLGIAAVVATASPLYQHKVGRANREVPYQHTLEKAPRRGPASRIWKPRFLREDEEDIEHVSKGSLEYLEDRELGETLWSVVADASFQHPRGAPKVQRKASHQDSSSSGLRRRRRQQVTDKFVEDSTSAILQEEGAAQEGEGGTNLGTATSTGTNDNTQIENDTYSSNESHNGAEEDDGGPQKNYAGFNVTAEIHYNISSPENQPDNVTETSSTVLTSSKQTDNNTAHSLYQPLRIRAILSEQRDGGEFLTLKAREILLKDIIRPALLTWSAALRVEPVVGNLTVDKFQLFDNQTCGPGLDSGLPSPKIPSYHLTEGLTDTDMILYLSIGFNPDVLNETQWVLNTTQEFWMQENQNTTLQNDFNDTVLEGFEDKDMEDKDYGDDYNRRKLKPTRWNYRQYPSAAPISPSPKDPPKPTTKPHFCTGDYVAAATYCSTDQYDRPTAGMLHICIDETFFLPQNRNRQIVTVMHEIGHALGFNARSMAHFRRPDGSPITPRVDGEIPEAEVECTGPSTGRKYANVSLPSEEILQFRSVRGGVRVAEVVTPSVVQVVRNHFDCQTLPGGELESGEYLPLTEDPGEISCIGSHWERRLFQNDLMNPMVDSVEYSPFISTITLAYFADSGWYQVDLSMAELAASWGRGAGCSFVEETCIGEDGQVSPTNTPFFCNSVPKTNPSGLVEEINGCTADMSRKAACSLGQYDLELPPEYQYFVLTYGATVGGNDPFIDYCPTYAGFSNGLCSSRENAQLIRVNKIEQFGPRNSRCLTGTSERQQTAFCLPIACVVEDRSLRVKVAGRWRLCSHKDEQLEFTENEYVVCPDPRRVCPTFYCHHDCLGTAGRCDYDSGACVCNVPNATSINGTSSPQITGTDRANFGICRLSEMEEHFTNTFASESDGDEKQPLMPHADSPLMDYYVPTKEALLNDSEFILETWQMASVVVCTLVFMAMLLWILRRKQMAEEAGGEGGGNDAPPPGTDPNKHKMIATVLVDMRMNGPDSSSVAPTADTACSFCASELESSASIQPSLGPDNDDRSSLASEDVLATNDVEPFDQKPRSEVRKRRFAPFRSK